MKAVAHLVALALLITGWATAAAAAEDALLRQIQDALIGKPVVLRNFYAGGELAYNSHGELVGTAARGTRLADGSVRINTVSLRGNSLELAGERLLQYYGPHGESLNAPIGLNVRLRVTLSTNDWPTVNHVLQRVFYRDGELTAGTPPKNERSVDGQFENCAPSDYTNRKWRRTGAHGKCVEASSIAEPIQVGQLPDGAKVFVASKAVTAPEAISTRDLKYTDEARKKHIKGSVVFRAVVDQRGRVDAMQLLQPLGYGLDQEAALALAQWTFVPAQLGDQPVAILMTANIQVHP